MGTHTSIYRSRYYDDDTDTKINITHRKKKVSVEAPVEVKEEFYIGKSLWCINHWFYNYFIKELEDAGLSLEDKDIHKDEMSNQYITLDSLKKLLEDINSVLKGEQAPGEVFPYLDEINKEYGKGILKISIEKKVVDEEKYDEYFYNSLKHLKEVIEKLIKEDGAVEGIYDEYVVDIG